MNLIRDYPLRVPLFPTQAALHQLILRTATLQTEEDIRFQINPKEISHWFDDKETVFEPL